MTEETAAKVVELLEAILATMQRIDRRLAGGRTETLSVDEACLELGCGKSKFYELLAAKQLVRAKSPGRKLRITLASVRAYQDTGTAPMPRRPRRTPVRMTDDPEAAIRALRVRPDPPRPRSKPVRQPTDEELEDLVR